MESGFEKVTELTVSAREWRDFIETMDYGAVCRNHMGEIIYANPAAQTILGLTLDQMQGKISLDYRWKAVREDKSDFPSEEYPAIQALKTGKKVNKVIMGLYHPLDNHFRWIIVNAAPQFRPGEGKPYMVFSTFDDITEMKASEDELSVAKLSLEIFSNELRETLNLSESQRLDIEEAKERAEALAKEAETANRAKVEFMANISHELLTPLNPILGVTDLLLEMDLPGEQKVLLADVKTGALRLAVMINDMIELSRLESDGLKSESQPLALESLLDAAVKSLAIEANGKNIAVTSRIAPDVPQLVCGNVQALTKLLKKIGENAVKFTEIGQVSLSVAMETKVKADDNGLWLRFSISDTGVGIPADRLPGLFQDFTQADGSKSRKYCGIGLGLTLSRRLVQLLGGEIWAESSEGRGTIFHFSLPFEVL